MVKPIPDGYHSLTPELIVAGAARAAAQERPAWLPCLVRESEAHAGSQRPNQRMTQARESPAMIRKLSIRLVTAAALASAACSAPTSSAVLGPPDAGSDPPAPADAVLLAQRPYTELLPPGYTSAQNWPLVIVLAGYGDHGIDIANWMGLVDLAGAQGAVLVAPDGVANALGYLAWSPGPRHSPHYDVEYLRAIIRDLEGRRSIDRKRVFVVGHSLGAHMAHRLACDAAADVAAAFTVAGQVVTNPLGCAPSEKVSVAQAHGTFDAVIGYNGDVQGAPPDPAVPSAHETMGVWARNNGCAGPSALTGRTLDLDKVVDGAETQVEAWSGCPDGIAVELWTMARVGHIPNWTPAFAPAVWGFLSGHAKK